MLICITVASLNAIDNNIYPGCKVLGQEGDVLTIELSEELASGTDASCMLASKLFHKITMDGFKIKVTNGHWDSVGIIDETRAREMAFNGAPY